MLTKTRLKAKEILYELKENAKSIDSGNIIESDDILRIMETGFSKMEYFHVIETREAIEDCVGEERGEKSLACKKAYAEYSLYVTLIGYLDSKIARLRRLYEQLIKENSDYIAMLAGKVATACNFRRRVLNDYLGVFGYEEEDFLDADNFLESSVENIIFKALFDTENVYGNFSQIIYIGHSNKQDLFLISGFIQAYLEGFKKADNFDIDSIISFYHKRRKSYIKYKNKCEGDRDEVKSILQKQNNPLHW